MTARPLPPHPPRTACLVPAATDLAAHLGLAVIGVSHECDHPCARGLPVLTRSVLAAHPEGPADVDRQVSAAVAAGEPLYLVDRTRLAALAPDLVISQSICDVCAARVGADELPPGARLVELMARDLAGLDADIRAVATAAGVPARGEACVAEVAAALAGLPRASGRPRVLALEWGDPPFLGGHWVPELIARVGGEHVLAAAGDASRRASWSEIVASDPDLVVFMPCGYDLEAALAEARTLVATGPLGELPCVRRGALWATNAVALFSRCTPRSVIAGATALAALLRGEPPPPGSAARVIDQQPGAADLPGSAH